MMQSIYREQSVVEKIAIPHDRKTPVSVALNVIISKKQTVPTVIRTKMVIMTNWVVPGEKSVPIYRGGFLYSLKGGE